MSSPGTEFDRIEASFAAGVFVDVRDTVRAILQGPASVACTRHPLGFFHLLLAREDNVSIRLHYWPASGRPDRVAESDIHDHVWLLQSWILAGAITNELIAPEEDPEGLVREAQIEQVDGVDRVEPVGGPVAPRVASRTTYGVGERYSILPRIFHRSEVAVGQDVLTVVRAEVAVPGGPRTLIPIGVLAHSPARESLSEAECLTLRAAASSLLGK